MAGYIGSKASVVSSGAERKKTFTITGATTSLTGLNYTVGKVHVFQNGVRLVDGTDYTATNGTTITLTVAAQSGDNVVVISQADFQVSGAVSTSGDTMTGDLNVTGTVTSDALTVDGIIRTINGTDIDMDGTASGQLKLDGNGYGGAIALNAQGMNIYTNSAIRDIIFGTNETEVMRIDGSENVLIGKTSSSVTTAGFEAQGNGQTIIGRANGAGLKVNRLSSDGDIVSLRKDGAVVGLIGTISGNLGIVSGNVGLRFRNTEADIIPVEGDFTSRDAAIDLGDPSYRFKNLYLSGGVYLGGTGSANLLDSYEEGTWSPTYLGSTGNPTITYDTETSASYIKVGKIVFIQGSIRTDAASGGSGTLYLGGLPFTSASTTSPKRKGGISVSGYQTSFSGSDKPTGGYIGTNVNHVILMSNRSTTSAITMQTTALNNTTNDNFMMFHGQYEID